MSIYMQEKKSDLLLSFAWKEGHHQLPSLLAT
jgi:hypothetical protein